MRDLAKQNLRRREVGKIGSKRAFRIGAVVFVIVGVVVVLNSGISLPVIGGGAEGVHDAPRGLKPVDVDTGVVNVDSGVNLASDQVSLRAAGSIKASGTAERIYGGGSFTMTVEATFAGQSGHKYQVWLTDGETVADAGFLESSGSTWSTTFRDRDKGYSKMNEIWVTDELTTEDNKPENKVVVGRF